MTKQVVYSEKGIDSRVLGADDLKKAGVEGFSKTTFESGKPVEVSAAVAKALTENEIFSGFSIVDTAEAEKAEAKAADAETEAVDSGTSQEAVGPQKAKGTNRASTP